MNTITNRKRNSLLMLGIILAVLAVAGMAMVGAVSAADENGNVCKVTIDGEEKYYDNIKKGVSALKIAESDATLQLLDNVALESSINLDNTNNIKLTFDLNGCVLKGPDGNRVMSIKRGVKDERPVEIIDNNPTKVHYFTINDSTYPGLWVWNGDSEVTDYVVYGGCITGGNIAENDGAGVKVTNTSTCSITGGNIVGNVITKQKEGSSSSGAGIAIDGTTSCSCTINGTNIIGNYSTGPCGGVNVKAGASFTMNGGNIIYNVSNGQGAGVLLGGDYTNMTISGLVSITDNKNLSDTTNPGDNVHKNEKSFKISIDSTVGLDTNSKIGVNAEFAEGKESAEIASGSKNYYACFTSDKSGCYIKGSSDLSLDKGGKTVTISPCTGISEYDYVINDSNEFTYSGPFSVESGSSVTLRAVDADGYLFKQWAEGETANPLTITVSEDVNYSPSVTTAYAVTLDKNGGNADGKAKVSKGNKKLTITTAPTMTGYAVEGYYTDSACSKNVAGADGALVASVSGYTDENGEWIKESDTTLYPKWVEVKEWDCGASTTSTPSHNIVAKLDDDGTMTLTGSGAMFDWKDMSDVPWYNEMGNITTLVIGDGITTVGVNAFNQCGKLAAVTIPSSVTTIGDSAFSGCLLLPEVKWNSVTSVGDDAFYGCSGIQEVSLPNVTNIGKFAFYNCEALETVYIPKVTVIKDDVFMGCKSLETFTWGNGTSIGANAFNGCNKLSSINLENVTTIGEYAFNGCNTLNNLKLDKVETIDEFAFFGCSALSTISLPNVKVIEGGTFGDCSNLSSVSLPEVTTIKNVEGGSGSQGAFYCCYKLAKVDLPKVTAIGDYAFYMENDSSSLSSVSLPVVETIGDSAFYGCDNLTSVSLPKVETIGDSAFLKCEKLTSVSLPKVKTIGDTAFMYCSGLKSITLSSAVTGIEAGTFAYCGSLESLVLDGKFTTAPTISEYAFSESTGPKYILSSVLQDATVMTAFDTAITKSTFAKNPVWYITALGTGETVPDGYYVAVMNNGKLADTFVQSVSTGGGYTLPVVSTESEKEEITRDGYLLHGWFSDSGCTSVLNPAELSISNKVAYASWFDTSGFDKNTWDLSVVDDTVVLKLKKDLDNEEGNTPGPVMIPANSGKIKIDLSFDGVAHHIVGKNGESAANPNGQPGIIIETSNTGKGTQLEIVNSVDSKNAYVKGGDGYQGDDAAGNGGAGISTSGTAGGKDTLTLSKTEGKGDVLVSGGKGADSKKAGVDGGDGGDGVKGDFSDITLNGSSRTTITGGNGGSYKGTGSGAGSDGGNGGSGIGGGSTAKTGTVTVKAGSEVKGGNGGKGGDSTDTGDAGTGGDGGSGVSGKNKVDVQSGGSVTGGDGGAGGKASGTDGKGGAGRNGGAGTENVTTTEVSGTLTGGNGGAGGDSKTSKDAGKGGAGGDGASGDSGNSGVDVKSGGSVTGGNGGNGGSASGTDGGKGGEGGAGGDAADNHKSVNVSGTAEKQGVLKGGNGGNGGDSSGSDAGKGGDGGAGTGGSVTTPTFGAYSSTTGGKGGNGGSSSGSGNGGTGGAGGNGNANGSSPTPDDNATVSGGNGGNGGNTSGTGSTGDGGKGGDRGVTEGKGSGGTDGSAGKKTRLVTISLPETGISGVTYAIDGGTATAYTDPFTIEYDHKLVLTATTVSGYRFEKWASGVTANPLTIEKVTDNISYSPTAVLDAATVTFSFDSTKGSVSPASVTVKAGTAFSSSGNVMTVGTTTVTATANTGYTFDSWNPAEGTVTGDTTITANFKKETTTVKITAETGGSVSPASVSNVAIGSRVTVSGDEIKIGDTTVKAEPDYLYIFNSWNIPDQQPVTKDMEIKASFRLLGTATLSYNGNGGTSTIPDTAYTLDEAGKATATVTGLRPVREGYTFTGWTDRNENQYSSGQTFTIEQNMTLYAQWEADTYTVTYKSSIGDVPAAKEAEYGEKWNLAKIDDTTDNIFAGWATTDNGPVVYGGEQEVKDLGTKTLYAVWEDAEEVATTVRGTLTGSKSDDKVQLRQGNTVVRSGKVGPDGNYEFSDVVLGLYDLVVIDSSGKTIYTDKVEITDSTAVIKDIELNRTAQSEYKVEPENDTPSAVAGNLDAEAKYQSKGEETGSTTTVLLTIASKKVEDIPDTPAYADELKVQESIKKIDTASNASNKEYLDLNVTKTVKNAKGETTKEEKITGTENLIEIAVPFDMTNKKNFAVYYQHGTEEAEPMTDLGDVPETPAEQGYAVDTANNKVHIYTKEFSVYAFCYDMVNVVSEATRGSSVTSFNAQKNGDTFTFSRSPVVVRATLPGASTAKLTKATGDGWYNFNLEASGMNGTGTVYFQVPLADISLKKMTTQDVGLYHQENGSWVLKPTYYQKSDNQYAYYEATIESCSPFKIDFKEGATKQGTTEQKTEDTQKSSETQKDSSSTQKSTTDTPKTSEDTKTTPTTTKSPFPVLGILAGLGAAVLYLRRR